MPEDQTPPIVLTPKSVLQGASPLVLTAALRPVGGLDRFQPAGFPEIGHVIYKAPRKDGHVENVCIVDSPASMANHLESVCLRGSHDYELVEGLAGMPYLRCVTGSLDSKLAENGREVVATSLTEGHRIASTYFAEGQIFDETGQLKTKRIKKKEKDKETGKEQEKEVDAPLRFDDIFVSEAGIVLANSKRAHPPAEKWWDVFKTIFRYDPNALVHGVLFPQYQIKIARFLTAHLEAFGAVRVDRSGVKFDRLGKTTSGQPIFAVDDETASEIRATFVLDVALLRSFGRTEDSSGGEKVRGLSEKQKEFIVALALWKIDRLLKTPFRYRSGCHLELVSLKYGAPGFELNDALDKKKDKRPDARLEVNVNDAIKAATFRGKGDSAPIVTDVYWPDDELYRESGDDDKPESPGGGDDGSESDDREDA